MSFQANQPSVTELLIANGKGDRQAFDRLLPPIYNELKRLASSHLRRVASDLAATPSGLDVALLNDCLERLESIDPQQGRVVELRFFAGLSVEETAEAMRISTVTVKREWAVAQA